MKRVLVLAVAALTPASALHAQQSQVTPAVPIRNLSPALARTTEPLGTVFGVRHLPGGKLLVNDGMRRRVVVFDSSLTSYKVTIDSTSGVANSYGPRSAPIVPYLGDSTLFVDFASQSLLVIDPSGEIKRVMAAPKPQDLAFLTQSGAGVDPRGRLIYRAVQRMAPPPPPPANAPPGPRIMPQPDSAPIVRADFETGSVDTLGRVKVATGTRVTTATNSQGQMTAKMIRHPLPQLDEWALLSDGSVAIVRGHDYHVDWIAPDDARTSTGKMPFDWRRLTDEDKQKFIDSARVADEAARAKAQEAQRNAPPGAVGDVAHGGAGGDRVMAVMRVEREAMATSGAMPPSAMVMTPEVEYVPARELPDYYPPIRQGATRADLDGNLWILPSTSAQSVGGELVYDVVNRKGELFQRVRVPAGRSIAGFGRGGIVYLMWRDGTAGWYVERTRILDTANVAQN